MVTSGTTSPERVDSLAALDGDLAEFVAQELESNDLELSLDSYYVDLPVERMCDTNGEATRHNHRDSPAIEQHPPIRFTARSDLAHLPAPGSVRFSV